MKPKRGRPTLPAKQRRTGALWVRGTAKEMAQLASMAKQQGVTTAALLRVAINGYAEARGYPAVFKEAW